MTTATLLSWVPPAHYNKSGKLAELISVVLHHNADPVSALFCSYYKTIRAFSKSLYFILTYSKTSTRVFWKFSIGL